MSIENNQIKDKSGKPPMHLLAQFYRALAEVAEVTDFGNRKYEPFSWPRVPAEDFRAAAMRHLMKALDGEVLDEESGRPHLAHAAWNCLAIMELERLES